MARRPLRRDQRGLAAALLVGVTALSLAVGCRRRPERPLELKLAPVKTRLRPHDALWYVLEMRNVGFEPIFVGDEFWADQSALGKNVRTHLDTYFEVVGPDNRPVAADFGWLGMHGEFDFWTNPPAKPGHLLQAGETMRTSPSIVAPVRTERFSDLRKDSFLSDRERGLALLRKREEKGMASWPEWIRIPSGRPASLPTNARILTGFDFLTPGKYRIRAVYEPIKKQWAEDNIRKGVFLFGGLPEGSRIFRFESAWVEFEVSS